MQEPKAVKQAAFPVWAPILVMVAVILTGVVLGLEKDAVPQVYFILFAIATVAVTLLVEVRGLFLTVASIPIYFVLGTIVIGWIATPNDGSAGRKAFILNSLYPSISHFLWLLFPFLAAVIIAVLRWWIYREDMARKAAYQEHLRRRRAAAERRNRDSYARARTSHASRAARPMLGKEEAESEENFELREDDRF